METQINIYAVLYILACHWVADFILQTDEDAKGKSHSMRRLLSHTVTYACFMWIAFSLAHAATCFPNITAIKYLNPVWFGLITLIVHTVQDYFTSRINAKLWKEGKVHLFFVSVGFDQLLHFIQLLVTYQILIK
jgi:L-asparagine transporter-like permease